MENFRQAWEEFSQTAHANSYAAGWWHDENGVCLINNTMVHAAKLLLIVTEVAEATEGLRTGKMDDKLIQRTQEEVELADVLIRLADYCAARGFDIAGAVEEKMAFNRTRPDHSLVVRRALGGKKF